MIIRNLRLEEATLPLCSALSSRQFDEMLYGRIDLKVLGMETLTDIAYKVMDKSIILKVKVLFKKLRNEEGYELDALIGSWTLGFIKDSDVVLLSFALYGLWQSLDIPPEPYRLKEEWLKSLISNFKPSMQKKIINKGLDKISSNCDDITEERLSMFKKTLLKDYRVNLIKQTNPEVALLPLNYNLLKNIRYDRLDQKIQAEPLPRGNND